MHDPAFPRSSCVLPRRDERTRAASCPRKSVTISDLAGFCEWAAEAPPGGYLVSADARLPPWPNTTDAKNGEAGYIPP